MTYPDQPLPRATDDDPTALDPANELDPADAGTDDAHHQPPHPPFAREPAEYTDPPGHHRRGPNGPALDVGA